MVQDYVEVWGSDSGASLVPLEGDKVAVGRAEANGIPVVDPAVSRLHAVLERYAAGWSVRDLGSANGTMVNGKQLVGEHRLNPGDEIRVGAVRLVFRSGSPDDLEGTMSVEDEPPELTKRERDVLMALCRPLLGSQSFAQAATIREIADELVVSPAAVKFHLSNIYDKFGIPETGHARRGQLANEAIRRGAVTISELQSHKWSS